MWLRTKHKPKLGHVPQSRGTCKLGVEQMLQQQQGKVHHTTTPTNREVVMRGAQETVKTGCGSVYFPFLGSLGCPTANNNCQILRHYI